MMKAVPVTHITDEPLVKWEDHKAPTGARCTVAMQAEEYGSRHKQEAVMEGGWPAGSYPEDPTD